MLLIRNEGRDVNQWLITDDNECQARDADINDNVDTLAVCFFSITPLCCDMFGIFTYPTDRHLLQN